MTDEKHEISIGGELTANGFKANVKSRWASAVDRLWGSKVDKKSIPIEAENAEVAAIAAGRVKMIETLSDLGVERLKSDPEFAARALENFLPSMLRKQENKDAVVELALEDLTATSQHEEESMSGPETLGDMFLNRFERFAEEATTDEVREKWAKVLAAEIRKPNTFSGKVLRIIDEVEPTTAALFERVCAHHVDGVLLKATLGNLPFHEITALVEAELVVDPVLGHIRQCREVTDSSGTRLWLFPLGRQAIALSVTSPPPDADKNGTKISDDSGKPALPIYILTDVGRALTSIVPSRTTDLIASAISELMNAAPRSEIRLYDRPEGGGQMTMIKSFPPQQS